MGDLLQLPAYTGRLLEDDAAAWKAIGAYVRSLEPEPFPARLTEAWDEITLLTYRNKLRDLTKRAITTDEVTTRKAVQFLNQARQRVVLELAQVDPKRFKAFYLPELKGAIDERLEDMNTRLRNLANGAIENQAWTGASDTAELINTLGFEVPVVEIPEELVRTAQEFSADLITNMSDELRGKISSTINRAVLAGESPGETISKIGRNLTDPSVFANIRSRAETIFRTETARIQGITGQAQLELAKDVVPELEKYWVAIKGPRTRPTHLAAGRRYAPGGSVGPIPVSGEYIVGGERLMYPGDPAGSAKNTINCRCRSVPFVPEPQVQKGEAPVDRPRAPGGKDDPKATAMANFRARHVEGGREFAGVIDPRTGERIMEKRGRLNSVFFTENERRAFKDKLLLHNHPDGRGLSDADIKFSLAHNLNGITAFGAPSSRGTYDFALDLSPAGKALSAVERRRVVKEFDKMYNKATELARAESLTLLAGGTVDQSQLDHDFPDLIVRKLLRPRTKLRKMVNYRRMRR